MKHLLLPTIAAVLLVGCGESQQSGSPAPEAKTEPPKAKAPDISIHEAARKGNIVAVKHYLDASADVNTNDWIKETPLHGAARMGHKEIAELLITNGADVNVKTQRSLTPLHLTAGHVRKEGGSRKEIAELLIAQCADVNAKDVDRWTTLDCAIINNHPEIADLLRKHGGKKGEELEAERALLNAARVGNIEAVKKHLDDGVDVNAMWDATGVTPLHSAANLGHIKIVELLVAEGADVNAKVEAGVYKGHTPLNSAIEFNNPETADLLRKHGGKTGEELEAEGK